MHTVGIYSEGKVLPVYVPTFIMNPLGDVGVFGGCLGDHELFLFLPPSQLL